MWKYYHSLETIQLKFKVPLSYFKNLLAGKLENTPTDPWAWHLHTETTEAHARHICAEYVDEKQLWQCPPHKPNHLWDCGVMNLVPAEIPGVRFRERPEITRERRQPEKNLLNHTKKQTVVGDMKEGDMIFVICEIRKVRNGASVVTILKWKREYEVMPIRKLGGQWVSHRAELADWWRKFVRGDAGMTSNREKKPVKKAA